MDIDALFAEHHGQLFRYLVRLTGDADLAEEVVQEAFMRLVEKPPRQPERGKAWLFRVATNLAHEVERTAKRRRGILRAHAHQVPAPAGSDDASRQLEVAELRITVRAALNNLSVRDRTVLLMREEGFAHREIAAAVDTTTNAVGVLIARAVEKLARQLAGKQEALQ